ncbi:MAG: hypothetical protein UR28_C0022G0023, partial [Candidatus Peregrinibacteria bacterium GW2011_GWF2_33_10]
MDNRPDLKATVRELRKNQTK